MSTTDSDPPGSESSSSSSPPPVRTCPHCGAVLAADAPEGQCPACLLLNLTLEPTAVSPTQPAEPPKPPSPPLTPEALAPHFAQLEILECLGRGGMGVVYKARQKSLNRLVALKLLAPEREKDAAFAERFTREAQALALLSHSHIVTVYDFGATNPSSEGAGDGFYYLLMEYVDGVNLRQLLDQRKLTAEEALKIVPPLCDALQYAHERGIVHRDIKPENLLLDRRGQVKIADFGIAKMMGNGTPSHTTGSESKEPASTALGVTQPETALGTPAYMAPEQASAPERVDSRADIYSLGVVFYEMLTGELPAKQMEATSSRLKHLHIDVRLDEIVLRALEKKPEMRWQTAADLRTRIEEVSSASASAAAPPELPGTPRHGDAAAPRPFRPWMQRFVARSFASRQWLFWCLLIAGVLLTACFMMPVSKYRAHPALIVPAERPYALNSKDEWVIRGEFGVPDAWWSETMRQATVPTVDADGKPVGRTAAGGPQIERSVNLFTWSYAMGLVAAIIWMVLWYCVAAEQRAGDRLPPAQRAFAAPLVDRSQGVRIRWWRILTLFLAFCGMSVAFSGHTTALMMLVLGDAPTPAFNALWTTFFLSFALIKGLGQELAGNPSTAPAYGDLSVMPHTRPNASQRTAVAVGVVMAFVVPFLIYWPTELMVGHVKDRFLISVFLVTWGVSTCLAHWVMRRGMLADVATRIWLRTTSVCGWLVSLPVLGFAGFSVVSLASESSGWNPAPAEAFIVPAFWLGAVLLPLASWYLWRVSGPPTVSQPPSGRSPWRVALGIFMLLAALVVPIIHLGSYSIVQARDQAAYLRHKTVLQQRAIVHEANLDRLQEMLRDLQAQERQASNQGKKAELQGRLDATRKTVASAERLAAVSRDEMQTLTQPAVAPGWGTGLGYLLLGSSACVAAALLLFRRPKASGDWCPRFILPVLLVVTLGYAGVTLAHGFWRVMPHSGQHGRVEFPFAYNHVVRGNVLVVTLTAKVNNRDVELRTLLSGAGMSREQEQLAARMYEGPKAAPGSIPLQPRKTLYRGTNVLELAFAFPDAATARDAGGNLQPVGVLSPVPGQPVSGILFQIRSRDHGMYQGEIQIAVPESHLSEADKLLVESASMPPLEPPGDASASDAYLVRLRSELQHWREQRKNLLLTFRPEHPLVKQVDERIEAAETMIDAVTEKMKEETGKAPVVSVLPSIPGAAPSDPPIMDTSDAALRTLEWQTFDQAPGKYWRQLANVRRFREAAELIERYLKLHPELEEGTQQMNGATLHFHAAQCHAFGRNKEKVLEHLKKSLHHLPSSSRESLLWNFYVNATTWFMMDSRGLMLSQYAELAQRAAFNDPNLVTLDRLLAGFGKPYEEAYQADDSADHKKLSADFFNRAWELMDMRHRRTAEEDAQMLSYAHASLAHWRQRDDCQTRNLSIAYWQISRVYAVLRNESGAHCFAQLCLAASTQESPYYLGYAYEAMARAASLMKSGDRWWFQEHLAKARAQAALVSEAGNRKRLERDLNELEASAPSSAVVPGLDAPVPVPAITTRTIKLTFATPHSSDEITGWLRSILSGPDESFQISPDKHSFTITAAPEAMYRAIACLRALDFTEPLVRPNDDGRVQPIRYFCDTATNTSRAFIHACTVRDYEAMASVMDLAVLSGFKDPKIESRVSFLRPYLGLGPAAFAKMRAESPDEVPEDLNAAWDALEKEVRGDWPGKREALEQLGRQFLQYPMERFALNSTSTDDLAVVRTYYEGTTRPPGVLCITPRVRYHDVQQKRYEISRCIPPETRASAGSILTK